MTNYITPNANYDLFSTASYAALDTYLKNDAIVKFKTVLDTVTSMFSSEILKCFEQKSSNSNPKNAGRRAYQPEFMFKLCLLQRRVNKADNDFVMDYFRDPQTLVKAIKEYRRTANIPTGEYSLSDLLK